MRKLPRFGFMLLLLTLPGFAQKHLWILRTTGEMVEYDPASFAVKQRVKLPAEAVKSPAGISVNQMGQILFATAVSLPLSEDDATGRKLWLWDGHAVSTVDQGVSRKATETGSNQAVTETAPLP